MKYRTCEKCGATLDFGERCNCDSQKRVTYQDWEKAGEFYSIVSPGVLVADAIVDEMVNNLPPATMRAGMVQIGEPYSHRYDEKRGRWRGTYATFVKAEDGWWRYCGNCFVGETEERGEDPVYIPAAK